MSRLDFVAEELSALRRAGRLRALRRLSGGQGPRVILDGRQVVNFSSNDYLGLAACGAVASAAADEARRLGGGAGASRLIAGNHGVHEDLEAALAGWQGSEAALVFNSGYQANIGVLTALAGRGDLVVSDALNHASLIDGCRLSRADVAIYRHGDAEHADALLAERGAGARRRFIVTDSVFSMDGDAAKLGPLAEVAATRDAVLVADEAHAVGVLGPAGRGLASSLGVELDVHVGTFGKAFGSFGAYVAGRADLRELLVNRARSFVFTTALPGSVVGASAAALELVGGEEGERRRQRLWGHVRMVKASLAELDLLAPSAGGSPIFPILVGDERAAMACCEALLARGIYVQGIRPPTVPRGTSRLRLALMATHEEADVAAALEALAGLRREGLLPAASAVAAAR